MSLKSALFELVAIRMPRARGFSKKFYFAHPFLDAWFAWFPLNQIQYDGAAVGEIFSVAARIDESEGATSWIAEWTKEGDRLEKLAEDLINAVRPAAGASSSVRGVPSKPPPAHYLRELPNPI